MTTARYEMRLRRRKRSNGASSGVEDDGNGNGNDSDEQQPYYNNDLAAPWMRRRAKVPRKSRLYEFVPVSPQRQSEMMSAISLHVYGRQITINDTNNNTTSSSGTEEEELDDDDEEYTTREEAAARRRQQKLLYQQQQRQQRRIQYQAQQQRLQQQQQQQNNNVIINRQPHVCKPEVIARLRAVHADTCRQTEIVKAQLRRLEQRYATAVSSISAKLSTKRP